MRMNLSRRRFERLWLSIEFFFAIHIHVNLFYTSNENPFSRENNI